MEQEKFLMERTRSILFIIFAENLDRDVNLFPGAKNMRCPIIGNRCLGRS